MQKLTEADAAGKKQYGEAWELNMQRLRESSGGLPEDTLRRAQGVRAVAQGAESWRARPRNVAKAERGNCRNLTGEARTVLAGLATLGVGIGRLVSAISRAG
jgi:hypothetical protein